MDGPVREGVGLLGSPSFEIPRTVDRDHQLDVTDPAEVRRLLRRKNRHNALTILMFLLSRWVLTSAITVLTLVAVDLHSELGLLVAAGRRRRCSRCPPATSSCSTGSCGG